MSKTNGSNYAYYKSLPENLNNFKLAANSISEYQIETNLSLVKNSDGDGLNPSINKAIKNSHNFLSFSNKTKRNLDEQINGISNQNMSSKNSAEKAFDQIIKLTYICYKNPLPKEQEKHQHIEGISIPSHFLKPKSFFSLRKSQKKSKDFKNNLSSSEIILNKEFPKLNQEKKIENIAHASHISVLNGSPYLEQENKNDSKTCNIVITNECNENEMGNLGQKISLENSYISACASTSVIDSVQPNTCFIPSLEYLINNSKSDLFSTQLAIANIAAVAADSDEVNKNYTNVNENVLQTFLKVVAPSTVESKHKLSQLDLTSVASDYSMNLNEKIANLTLQNQKSFEIPTAINSTSLYTAGVINLNNKLINEQIMKTCMGYLDFIKTKHGKQRRLQAIKNKISGFILLTILFLFLISLFFVMAISLTKTISKVIGQSNETIPIANAKKQIEKLKTELTSIVEVNKRIWESKIRNEIKAFLAGLNKKIIGDKSLMSKELQLSFEKNVKNLNFIIFNLLNNLYTKNSIDNEYFIEASIHYLRYIEELN